MESLQVDHVLRHLDRVRPGGTICPGLLARRLGTDPSSLRPVLADLEQQGRIAILQRGQRKSLGEVRGPFRVAPVRSRLPGREFAGWVGIDYSGAGHPQSPQRGLRVFVAHPAGPPQEMAGPEAAGRWSRQALFSWLRRLADAGAPFLIGVDHALGVPWEWAQSQGLGDWDAVLRHVSRSWPADRYPLADLRVKKPFPAVAEGYRLCDRWAAGAKSVFHFDVPGSVAGSTFAGLPWVARLRQVAGHRIHFWPFDGWVPAPGKTVLAEIYPSLWRRRFATPRDLDADQRDAWTVAAWMRWAATGDHLIRYWQPPLNDEEKARAAVEGWILGVV